MSRGDDEKEVDIKGGCFQRGVMKIRGARTSAEGDPSGEVWGEREKGEGNNPTVRPNPVGKSY